MSAPQSVQEMVYKINQLGGVKGPTPLRESDPMTVTAAHKRRSVFAKSARVRGLHEHPPFWP